MAGRAAVVFLLAFSLVATSRGEALLQLFNVHWDELIEKMPEIAEAGYTSLWLPPPAKAGSVYSAGYDLFDPFDLGDKNQRGTVRTRYGTKAQLLQVVETAHRFGIRVYFDNIMNHRGFDTPGFNANTPPNFYPGLLPQDFHLKTVAGGYYANWPNVANWNNVWEVQNQPLFGLVDLANEGGTSNLNFGPTLGSTLPKFSFVRHPGSNSYYMVTNLPAIAGPWRPFNGSNGVPVSEDVNAYLIRAVLWTLNETRCDGFRLDAVKHVPSDFFGATGPTPDGYTGALQAMFDYVHGYGTNAAGNGYLEADNSRNSCFDTEVPRNDALLFGEHLGEPPGFQEYLDRGMRLLNVPYHFQFNTIFGNPGASLSGLDQRDYRPYGSAFTGPQSVLFAQSHDDGVAIRRELHNAYNFMREGLPSIYSDGYNHSSAGPGEEPFPRIANAPYLGQFGDRKMPDMAYLHHQLARGGTRSRWSDNDIVAFERYDYRDTTNAFANPQATVALFVMNDNYASSISFDDSYQQTTAGTFYECFPVNSSRGLGLVVGFPPGSVLAQLADSPGKELACDKLLVRLATSSTNEAFQTRNHPDPVQRKVYVGGQSLAPGGGAVEVKIPSGSYVIYGYQWPEPSRVNLRTPTNLHDVIRLVQDGVDCARLVTYRRDGVNGDSAFNPLYPFKMRGSVDPISGAVAAGINVSNRTYAIDAPVVTNGLLDILVRTDASALNALIKLDGGVDLNSQMGLEPVAGFDRRDHRPGHVSDVFLGYEQSTHQFRFGPEKFAAQDISRNNVTSLGAETYHYTVGGTNFAVNGAGNAAGINSQTASWVYHQPAATNSAAAPHQTPTQRMPLDPGTNQPVDLWVKVGYQLQIDRCFVYFTTDGSNPEGAFGIPVGTTKIVEALWVAPDSLDSTIDWWKGTIAASNHLTGAQVRYKIALFNQNAEPISDADPAKLFGLSQSAILGFNPNAAAVWRHNNLNTNQTATGLVEGFHLVRARSFLPRSGKAGVFNTFLQTFYYDPQPPGGVIAFPPANGTTLNNSNYNCVVRADSTVTAVEFNIIDNDPANDDTATGQNNGNGQSNGAPIFITASEVAPETGLNQQFPNYPQEFRFNYNLVPTNGTGTITVRLKELTSNVISNRVTTLVRSVNTLAPVQSVQIAVPATNGMLLVLSSNEVYVLQACYSSNLTISDSNLFSVLINGQLQPRAGYIFRPTGCAAQQRSLYFNWTNPPAGTNLIEVIFTNAITLADSRLVVVARPGDSDGDGMLDAAEIIAGTDPYNTNSVLRITAFETGNRVLVWDSVSNINYRVLATTNLASPLVPISPTIPSSGASTVYFDGSPEAAARFYRVQVVP